MAEKKKKILYIEDDPSNRRLVERVLVHAGYDVHMAFTALDGIDKAREIQPDLILTDINLPDLSGHEIATTLRSEEQFKSTPIVAFSAMTYDEHHGMAMAAGVDGFLTKPLDAEKFPDQIQFYLDGGRDKIETGRLSDGQKKFTQQVVRRLENRIRKLEASNEDLKRLDRMKETFIQITAHELRTPLTLVFGYIRLLKDYPAINTIMQNDPMIEQLIDGLMDSTTRMHHIIDEILTVSRIMTESIDIKITQVNLQTLLHEIIAEFQSALTERNLQLHYDSSAFPTNMQADGHLLELAFRNLISNAIKFTPDQGHIYLKAETKFSQIHIVIEDTGIGINKSDQLHIFEPFHVLGDVDFHSTSKTAFGGGGLGLGLPICRGIMDAHGGTITVESRRRDETNLPGSKFTVMLPLITQRPNKNTT